MGMGSISLASVGMGMVSRADFNAAEFLPVWRHGSSQPWPAIFFLLFATHIQGFISIQTLLSIISCTMEFTNESYSPFEYHILQLPDRFLVLRSSPKALAQPVGSHVISTIAKPLLALVHLTRR